jgi:SMP-30/Gluconolactonase/LRE-like region
MEKAMRRNALLVLAGLVTFAVATIAQQQPVDPIRTPGVQAGRDPNRDAFIMKNCRAAVPTPAAAGRGRGNAGRGGAGGGQPATFENAGVTGIPGVVAAGQRWRKIWEGSGNNTDSPIATDKGILLAMNDLSQIAEIGLDGSLTVIATDTYTGGALALTPDGTLYVGERALNRGIWRVSPRRLFTNTMNGEPLECLGPGVLNDMVADKKGGMYMTMGGVYYANAKGVVSGRYGTVGGNGIAVSRDDRTLYVTGRLAGAVPPSDLKLPAGAPTPTGGLVAFDIQPDGSLKNERQFAWAGNDGSAVDTEGRIYTPGNGGAWIIDPETGAFLGYFATPLGTHGLHFGGANKRTLFAITLNAQTSVWAMDMLSTGFQVGEWKR